MRIERFGDLRVQLDRAYRLPAGWWPRVPRVASKSGWITYSAHRDLMLRSRMQVALCRLALMILEDTGKDLAANQNLARFHA